MPADRKSRIIDGEPGTAWTNDTPKVQFQLRVSFFNSCGRCIEDANKIGPWWSIPYHRGCNCSNVPIPPGHQSAPFLDYQEEVRKLDPGQQRRVMGKGNWALVESGAVKWEDVVTRTRIRPLSEVVKRQGLSPDGMKKAGVNPRQAALAWAKANSPDALAIQAKRAEVVAKLRDGGLTDAEIKEFLAKSLASKTGIGPGPPSGGGKAGTPPTPPRKPPLLPPKPIPKPPKPKPVPKLPKPKPVPKPPKPIKPPPKPIEPPKPPPKPIEPPKPPPKPVPPKLTEIDHLRVEVDRLRAEFDKIKARDGNTFTDERFKARDAYLDATRRLRELEAGGPIAPPPRPVVPPPKPIVPPPQPSAPKPEPKPEPKPAIEPKPKPEPKPETSPGRIPPGHIADRIKAYSEGDHKVKAIVDQIKPLEDAFVKAKGELLHWKAGVEYLGQKKYEIENEMHKASYAKDKEGAKVKKEELKAVSAKLADAKTKLAETEKKVNLANHQENVRKTLAKILKVDDPTEMVARDRMVRDYDGNSMEKIGSIPSSLQADNQKKAFGFLNGIIKKGDVAKLEISSGERPGQRAHCFNDRGGTDNYYIVSDASSIQTHVHELGHFLEYRITTDGEPLMKRVGEFLKHRFGDEKEQQLNKVMSGTKFNDNEYGRKDKMEDLLGEARAWYSGKEYRDGATELTSLGLETLFSDPVGMATKDPEYTKFIMGLLDGKLR